MQQVQAQLTAVEAAVGKLPAYIQSAKSLQTYIQYYNEVQQVPVNFPGRPITAHLRY